MFALKYKDTGKLVGFYATSLDGEISPDVIYRLSHSGDNFWVTTSRAVAEKAAVTDTEMYNADFDTPINPYIGKLEVVELVLK